MVEQKFTGLATQGRKGASHINQQHWRGKASCNVHVVYIGQRQEQERWVGTEIGPINLQGGVDIRVSHGQEAAVVGLNGGRLGRQHTHTPKRHLRECIRVRHDSVDDMT